MKKYNFFYPFIAIFILTGCKKESARPGNSPQGIFNATLEGESWQPTLYNAVYFKNKQFLSIIASDNQSRSMGVYIYLDSIHPEKTYVIEPFGENQAQFESAGTGIHMSDYDTTDAGGSFTLISFDTVNNTLSGNLSFTGYNNDGSGRLLFSAPQINDILLITDTGVYDGNFISATIQVGSRTVNWQTKSCNAETDCSSGLYDKRIGVSALTFGSYSKLNFHIPLLNTVGAKQLYPHTDPYFYCGRLDITSFFCPQRYSKVLQCSIRFVQYH